MNKYIDIYIKLKIMATKNRQALTLKKSHLKGGNPSRSPHVQKTRAKILLRALSVFLFLALWVGLCFRFEIFLTESLACSAIIGIIYSIKTSEEFNNIK
jgi:hypothetical protein